jgi:dihydroorotate dehydrogenase
LRKLQNFENLTNLLNQIKRANEKSIPIFIKIAPDMSDSHLKEISGILLEHKVTGAIISNTTLNHDCIPKERDEIGGLSGKPLFEMSTHQLKKMYQYTEGKLILIGVGGIFDGKDVYDKMRSGATLVQIYSGLIFEGPKIVPNIKKELLELLERDGFKNIKEIIGIDAKMKID